MFLQKLLRIVFSVALLAMKCFECRRLSGVRFRDENSTHQKHVCVFYSTKTHSGRGNQFAFIRFLPLRNPACPPAGLRRSSPSTTGCFRRKPLPPSRRG